MVPRGVPYPRGQPLGGQCVIVIALQSRPISRHSQKIAVPCRGLLRAAKGHLKRLRVQTSHNISQREQRDGFSHAYNRDGHISMTKHGVFVCTYNIITIARRECSITRRLVPYGITRQNENVLT